MAKSVVVLSFIMGSVAKAGFNVQSRIRNNNKKNLECFLEVCLEVSF